MGCTSTVWPMRSPVARGVVPSVERTRDQRLFDAAVDLLTGGPGAGGWHVDLIVPVSVARSGTSLLSAPTE